LARFRHQNFLLFLIAHFQRAALLMFSDRLAEAVGRLDIRNSEAVRTFRQDSRAALEAFLRFTHRYWFYEISDQAETAELFEMCRRHLGLDRLYADIRQEAQYMNHYLESEAVRRQNDTVVRLTVVTILGLVGTIVTGFLGMNLFAFDQEPAPTKVLPFVAVMVPTLLLTFYTVKRSRRLSEFLEALSDEELPLRAKWQALVRIWKAPRPLAPKAGK
jgi:Mg2+ and Co2+ transporter CorA